MTEDDTDVPAPEVQDDNQGTPVAEPEAESGEGQGNPEDNAGANDGPESSEKPKNRGDRRFAHLTARAAAEAQRADQAERRAQELQALLEGRNGSQEPQERRPIAETDVDRRAQEMLSARAMDEKRIGLIQSGLKTFGKEAWQEKTDFLANMGALQNPTFMRALVQAPGGDKIVSELADDPDRLADLMKMDPIDMAVEMGRLSAEVSGSKGRRVSSAPAPAKNLTARATPPTPDIYNTKTMSMKEYAALRAKTAPRHLGGKAGR